MSRAGAARYCAWAFTSANFHQCTPKISFLWCCLYPPVQINFHALISSKVLNSVRVFAQTKIPSISFRGWISLKHWSEKYGHFYLHNYLFLILITNRRCGNSGVLWAVQFLIKCSQSAGLLWSPWGENSIMRPKALWLHPISNFILIIIFFFLHSAGIRKTASCLMQVLPTVNMCHHSRAAVMGGRCAHVSWAVFPLCV